MSSESMICTWCLVKNPNRKAKLQLGQIKLIFFTESRSILTLSLVLVYLMQTLYQTLVILVAALDHPGERVGEPLLEVSMGLKDMRHEEMHERPQLHEAVL